MPRIRRRFVRQDEQLVPYAFDQTAVASGRQVRAPDGFAEQRVAGKRNAVFFIIKAYAAPGVAGCGRACVLFLARCFRSVLYRRLELFDRE